VRAARFLVVAVLPFQHHPQAGVSAVVHGVLPNVRDTWVFDLHGNSRVGALLHGAEDAPLLPYTAAEPNLHRRGASFSELTQPVVAWPVPLNQLLRRKRRGGSP
jgi:hypothetical protein